MMVPSQPQPHPNYTSRYMLVSSLPKPYPHYTGLYISIQQSAQLYVLAPNSVEEEKTVQHIFLRNTYYEKWTFCMYI